MSTASTLFDSWNVFMLSNKRPALVSLNLQLLCSLMRAEPTESPHVRRSVKAAQSTSRLDFLRSGEQQRQRGGGVTRVLRRWNTSNHRPQLPSFQLQFKPQHRDTSSE